MRNRRPDRVASSTTRGTTSAPAWSRAQPLGGRAVAGDVAVEREADGVEDAGLAGAGRPAEQEQAGVGERVEVDGRPVSANGPNAGDLELVEPHRPPPRRGADQHVVVGVVAARVDGLAEQRGLAVRGRAPRTSATKSRAMSWSLRPDAGRGAGRRASAAGAAELQHQGVGEAAPQPLHRLRRAGRVGERGLHPVVLVVGERRVGEQVVERAARSAQPPRDRRVDELRAARARRRRGRPARSP